MDKYNIPPFVYMSLSIKLPSSWNSVKIHQFVALISISKSLSDEERAVEIISILSGVAPSEIRKLTYKSLVKATNSVAFVKDTSSLSREIKNKITVKGVDYNLHYDMENISAGQLIDITNASNGWPKNMAKLLACVYVPDGEEYNQTPVKETAMIFDEHLPLSVAYSTGFFFYQSWQDSSKTMLDYLENHLKMMDKKKKKIIKEMVDSQKNGAGSSLLTGFLSTLTRIGNGLLGRKQLIS